MVGVEEVNLELGHRFGGGALQRDIVPPSVGPVGLCMLVPFKRLGAFQDRKQLTIG